MINLYLGFLVQENTLIKLLGQLTSFFICDPLPQCWNKRLIPGITSVVRIEAIPVSNQLVEHTYQMQLLNNQQLRKKTNTEPPLQQNDQQISSKSVMPEEDNN